MIDYINKIVVVAPHPDDELLGAGGTISRLISQGAEVNILIVGGHLPPVYNTVQYEETKQEAIKAFKYLNITSHEFLDIPATTFNLVPRHIFNERIKNFIDKIKPDMVLLPFPDRHIDHRIVFDSAVVACRPLTNFSPKFVLCYETLSETHWNVSGIEANFNPDFFIDISLFIESKILALQYYKSQINDFGPRGLEANKALARFRGSQNNCTYAEAFKVVRILL
ncbi:PIG-L family deacetylase [Alphaproteobacteria bacterium]|nr:PIG-L family deacetylase [Alphaproteobacteria bacterium]